MSEKKYRDTSGRTLDDYPRPSVAVDTAVLTLDPDLGLVVLEVRRTYGHGLGTCRAPSCTRVRRSPTQSTGRCATRPTCADCIRASCTSSTTLGATTVAGCCPLPTSTWCRAERLESRFADTTRLVPVDAPGRLPYDHDDIIALAVAHVRSRYADKPDPDRPARRRVHASGTATRARGDRRTTCCSATPFDARWNRNSSPLAKRRSAPEGVPQRCSARQADAEPTRRRKL